MLLAWLLLFCAVLLILGGIGWMVDRKPLQVSKQWTRRLDRNSEWWK